MKYLLLKERIMHSTGLLRTGSRPKNTRVREANFSSTGRTFEQAGGMNGECAT